MSYTFNESTNSYVISSDLDEDDLYDTLLAVAKEHDIIDANHATNSSHILWMLRNNSVDVEFETE